MESNSVQPRVLHLDDGRLWRGGQHQVWLLLRELAALGIAQQLLAREDCPLAERARQAGIQVEPVNFRGELDFLSPRRIATLARDFEANIIHAHTGHAQSIGLRAARRLKGRVQLISTRRVDFPVSQGFFSRRKYTAPDQHFIAISEGVRQVLLQGGVAPERIDRVASGVPPIPETEAWPRERVRRELGIAEGELAIVNIGALTDHKGQRWLIEAAPQILQAFPQARIYILGEGELRGALEQQIKALALADKIRMPGFVENVRFKLAGFDLFVSSSHLEGLGTAILDAMLAGLPVVAAEAGGVPDAVIENRTGLLVPPRDPAALARGVIQALQSPEVTGQLIQQARQYVEQNFSAGAMAQGTLAVYRKILLNPNKDI